MEQEQSEFDSRDYKTRKGLQNYFKISKKPQKKASVLEFF